MGKGCIGRIKENKRINIKLVMQHELLSASTYHEQEAFLPILRNTILR